jgi:hypothetical protein
MTSVASLRRQLERARAAVPAPRPFVRNSEEMSRAGAALVAELATQGILPRPSLGSDELDIERAMAEVRERVRP